MLFWTLRRDEKRSEIAGFLNGGVWNNQQFEISKFKLFGSNCSCNIPVEVASSGLTSGLKSSLLIHRWPTGDDMLGMLSSLSLTFTSSSSSSSTVTAPVVISSFCPVSWWVLLSAVGFSSLFCLHKIQTIIILVNVIIILIISYLETLILTLQVLHLPVYITLVQTSSLVLRNKNIYIFWSSLPTVIKYAQYLKDECRKTVNPKRRK